MSNHLGIQSHFGHQNRKTKEVNLLNPCIMDTIFIKTHQTGAKYEKPHFFILSKGLNSGNEIHQHQKNNIKALIKPYHEPFTNSFVLVFQTEEQKEDIFWIAMSLWKSKFWMPFLSGSVIPFLSLYEFKKEFNPRATRLMREHELHKKNIQALKLLQEQENHHHKNIHLINELKNAIMMRYRNK